MPHLSAVPALFLALSSAVSVLSTATKAPVRFEAPVCTGAACDTECVEPGRYVATRDVVADQTDGKLWQRQVSMHLTQQDAATYCGTLALGGKTGWRLPDATELASLKYKAAGLGGGHAHVCSPAIDQAAFPATPAAEFWTSRVGADDTGWYLGFDDGRAHWAEASSEFAVRCVHD